MRAHNKYGARPTYDELLAEVAELRQLLGFEVCEETSANLQRALRIAPYAARILTSLYLAKGRTRSEAALEDAIPERTCPDIVRVYISSLRKTLGRSAIDNIWSRGYVLTLEGRSRCEQALGVVPSGAPVET